METRLLIGDVVEVINELSWEDILTNWESYLIEWQESGLVDSFSLVYPVVDLFQAENLVIKQVVKDVTDPAKLFTDYSRDLTVPASKVNNRIFKHYYNLDIDNGFDARRLVPAAILIGNVTYKLGNVALESVSMKGGVAESYSIRFYGKLTEIGKAIGVDKLSGLNLASLLSVDIQSKFSNTVKNDIVFPLNSKYNRYKYGAAVTDFDDVERTKVINYIDATHNPDNYGIQPFDLHGAIKVGYLLDRIENKYGFTITGALRQDYVEDLYLWLSNNKEQEDGSTLNAYASNLSPTSSSNTGVFVSGGSITFSYVSPTIAYSVSARATWTGNGKVVIYRNGSPVAESTTSGSYTPDVYIDYYSTVTFRVYTETAQNVNLTVDNYNEQNFSTENFTETITVNSVADYITSEYIPDMRVMDFLKALFKMFNIIAEVDNNSNITTYHQDGYMAQGDVVELGDYVSVDSVVKAPTYYSSVRFNHKYNETAIEVGYKTTAGDNYGSLEYEASGQDFKAQGMEYKIESGVSVLPLEHITDGSTLTGIVHTYFGDTDKNNTNIGAAFTYVRPSSTTVAFDNGTSTSSVASYLVPSNIFDPLHNNVSTSFKNGLYYGEELMDSSPSTNVLGLGLYNSFYRGLVSTMFDESKRIVSMDARLPLKVIKDLKINDVVSIRGNYYNIHSTEIDHTTGDSKLVLVQVGRERLTHWTNYTATATNSSGATAYITFINSSGYLETTSVLDGNSITINTIGEVLRDSANLSWSYAY